MAFSTQKVFFHLPFYDEAVAFKCDRACVKMKTYPSSHDGRAWAASESKKSRFVTDLVACNTPIAIRPVEEPGNKQNNSSAKKPKKPDNNKRAGVQSKKPDQRRRGQDDYENRDKHVENKDYGRRSQVRYIRPDSGSRGGLNQRRSFGCVPQKGQNPTSRRNLGPNQDGQGSTLRKRIFTNSDEESLVRGGRGKISQNSSFYKSPSREPGRFNQLIVEYPTQDQGGNDRHGNENPYICMGQVDQGSNCYKDSTDQSMAPDTDVRCNNRDQSPEPIQEQRIYGYQGNQEEGDGEAARGEYERYENYESDYSAPRGYVYNSRLREDGSDNYGRTHLERYDPSYRRNDSYRPPQRPNCIDGTCLRQLNHSYSSNQEYERSGNRHTQDLDLPCCHRQSNYRSSGRYKTVPPYIQLQRQQAYERLCAFAASYRRNYYGHT